MVASLKEISIVLILFATVSFAWTPYARWRKNRTPFFRTSNSNYASFARPPQRYTDVDSDEDSSEGLSPLAKSLKKLFDRTDVCDKCPPGYGLVSMCNATQRTVCQPCTLGLTYSALEPHFKPCTPCSKCGENMYEDISCTTFTDTFCDSCLTKRGLRNEDYLIKCKRDPNAIDKFEIDSSEFDKELFDDLEFDKVQPSKLEPVFRETENELDQMSKEDEKPDDFDEQINKIFDDVQQELDEDDESDVLNITRFENAIDDSVKEVKPENNYLDKSSDEDDWKWDEQERILFTQSPLDDDDKLEYDASDDDFVALPRKKDIVYKPSEHGYPYEDLLHPDIREKQIRKVVWLYGITAIMLMMAIMFLTCYAGSYYRRRRAYRTVRLTDQDIRIIREGAQILDRSQNQTDNKRRNPFINSNEDGLKIVENPLEEYLDDQAFNGSTESLIPNIHKGQKSKQIV